MAGGRNLEEDAEKRGRNKGYEGEEGRREKMGNDCEAGEERRQGGVIEKGEEIGRVWRVGVNEDLTMEERKKRWLKRQDRRGRREEE